MRGGTDAPSKWALAFAQILSSHRRFTSRGMGEEFGEAFSRLESAERELSAAEMAFVQSVHLFLIGKAAAPSQEVVAQVCAKRAAVVPALAALRTVLERCRRSIKLI
jgi:hypothetical protein